MTPTIQGINIGGYRFFFRAAEGLVPHVHVETASGDILWWLGKDGPRVVSLKKDHGVSSKDKRKSKQYTEEHYDTILEAWNDFFSNHGRDVNGAAGPDAFVWDIQDNGFWLYAKQELYWIAFADHPVFRYATDDELIDFDFNSTTEALRWPAIDADYSLEIFRHPERYPLRAIHQRERDGSSRYR